jgi:foldase protein PrsA
MPKAHRFFAGIVTALLTTSLVACAGGGSIATVNGQALSKADFDQKLEGSPAARGVLQQMAQEALLEQYARTNNIQISDADIKAKEDQIKTNFPAGSWDDMLKQRGMTENDVHTALREQLIIDKAVGAGITITPAQVKAYFDKNHATFDKPEQVRARHILVADLPTAEKIEAQLKAGAKFEDMAEKYSTDTTSKVKGGELGFFRRGQMVPTFDQAAFSLPVGTISQPVKSPFGYHIIQVEEKQPGVKATLANTQEKITETLRQQQEQPLISPFMQSLQAKANIQVNDPRFADVFPTPAPTPPVTTSAAPAAAPATSTKP